MNNYLLFLDESGDHSLKTVHRDFPVFVLAGLLFKTEEYRKICEAVDNFKLKYFKTKSVVLHSREIRKCEGPFQILFDLNVKKKFYSDLNRLFLSANYQIVASAINKQRHIAKYGKLADDPYEIALTFVLERSLFATDTDRNRQNIKVTIEGRGRVEDEQISNRYNQILYRGTGQVKADRFLSVYEKELAVRLKRENDCGLQLADLCAYPIARYVLNNDEPNPTFDVIKNRIRSGSRGFTGYGIKVFP